MAFLTLSLIIILAICLFLYLYKYSRERPPNFPPGPPKLPFWGSYWFMLKEHYKHPHLSFEILGKRYQTDILGLHLGTIPTVVTFTNELCRELLTREEFIGRPDTIIIRTRSLGDPRGIFFIDGEFWKEQRRFSLRHMRDFGFGRRHEKIENFVIDEVRSLIELLSSEAQNDMKDVCRGKGHVSMPDVLYGPLLNMILLVLASSSFDNYKLREIARAGLRFQRSGDVTGDAISMTPWLRHIAPDFFGYTPAIIENGYMLKFLNGIIDEHKQTYSENHPRDFIDMYLKAINEQGKTDDNTPIFDERQLLLTLLDYLFPSAIAVGHTLNFYFAYLINNPHVQVKIQDEIERVIGRSRLANLDDRKFMPYTEASIREGVRILPINPLGIPRRCVKDTTLRGYFIPKDTLMLPCIWTAHKDKTIWSDTEMFLPERFLDDKGNLMKKDYTLGFGNGKRLCAGETFARQNMFLLVAGLLQNFTFQSWNGKPVDLSDIVPGVNVSLKENWVQAIPR